MAGAYTRLLLARLRARLSQALLSVGVVTAATALLLIAIAVRGAATAPVERLIDEVSGPHVMVYGPSAETINDIVASAAPQGSGRVVAASVVDDGSTSRGGRTYPLQFWSVDGSDGTAAISIGGAGRLVDGRWLRGPGEAVLDAGLASRARIAIGDQISLSGPGRSVTVTVVGTAVVTMRAPYPIWDPAVAFVEETDIAMLRGTRAERFAVGLRLRDGARTDDVVTMLTQGMRQSTGQVAIGRWTAIREAVEDELVGSVMVLQTFGGFALVAALLILGNLAAARLLVDRRDIGVLKAIGFTPIGVGFVYVLELTALAVTAVLLGTVIAFALAPLFLEPIATLLHTTPEVSIPVSGLVWVATAVTGLSAASALIPAIQAARLATVQALNTLPARNSRRSWLVRLAAMLGAPLSVRTGLTDAFARPVRAWITILAIGMLGATAVATLTFESTIDGYVEHPERTGIPPLDLIVTPVDSERQATTANVANIGAELESVDAVVTMSTGLADVRFVRERAATNERIMTRLLGGDIDASGIPIVSGRLPGKVHETAVGLGFARSRGITVGDTLNATLVLPDGRVPHELEVVGVYVEHSSDGRVLLLHGEAIANSLGHAFEPREIALRIAAGASVDDLRSALEQRLAGRALISEGRSSLLAEVTAVRAGLRPIMLSLNALLLVIAGFNLMTVLVIAIKERSHEIATLRAIGFTPAQIRIGVLTSAVTLGTLGIAIGVPTGYVVVRWLLLGVAGDEGWSTNVVTPPNLVGWGTLAVLGVLVAAAAAAVPAFTATRTPLHQGLRAE